jgi:hypothetical protein
MNDPLALISKADAALSAAVEITEMMDLRAQAKAVEAAAVALGLAEVAQHAKVFQLRAERKAGGWLTEHIRRGRPSESSQDGRVLLSDLDIGYNDSARWQSLASIPQEKFNSYLDEHLSRGWEVTAGGLRRYAQNVNAPRDARPRMASVFLHVPSGTCALYGYLIGCSGELQGHHLISKDMARGNDEIRDLLRTCPPELMAKVCVAHNVGKIADSHGARRILLLQKVYEYGLVHMWNYINSLPWKVRMPEERFEAMLEPKEVKT